MSATTIIADAFGEDANLYTDVLGLSSSGENVTLSQMRKAYYKRALKYHPDKQDPTSGPNELEDAKVKFQAVSVAYSILSDPEKRKEYDENGELNDDDDFSREKDGANVWAEYFRGIFGTVTMEDIDKFSLQYKCSDEEERDVLKYYNQFQGNLDKMLECVMCSNEIDKKRWVEDYINPAIKKGDVKNYEHELERTLGKDEGKDEKKLNDDMDEDETESDDSSERVLKKNKSQKKKGNKVKAKKKSSRAKHNKNKDASNGPDDDLIAAIRGKSFARRQIAFDSMMVGLEERYTKKSKKKARDSKKSKKAMDDYDIPEDEFQKTRAKLDARKNR